jgi:hypothetical protein
MSGFFIALSSACALVSPLFYIHAIWRGEARPHRTTRLVLFIITTLSTVSLLVAGDRVAVWLAGVSALQSILILGLSVPFGMGGWSRFDIMCLVIAFAGIALWQLTSDPFMGLYASIIADFTGVTPTLIKAYRHPYTEAYAFFLLDVFAGVFSMLALSAWTPDSAAYPLYIACVNAAVVSMIWLGRRNAAAQTI